MTTPDTNDIVRLAEQQLAAKRNLGTTVRDLPWRYAFIGLAAVLLLALLFWPGYSLDRKMYAVVHGVCAQVHNVQLGGVDLPLCARNTGIYSSYLITTLYLLALGRARAAMLPPIPITLTLLLLTGIMAVDGFNSMFRDLFLPHLYVPRNDLRTLTGMGMGMMLAVLLLMIINVSLRRYPDDKTPVLRNWRELFGGMAINLLVLTAIYGNIAITYWPIAIIAWLGLVGILFVVNLLIASMLMGYEARMERPAQLARPATVSLVVTGIMLGAFSWVRFWMESQGLQLG